MSADQKTKDAVPALLVALDAKFPNVAEILIRRGASVNCSDKLGIVSL